MAEEEKDQDAKETLSSEEEKGQSEGEQSQEEATKPEELVSLVKGLQKGYTITRQELSELKDSIQGIVDKTNEDSGAKEGEDEYLTVGKLRGLLQEEYSRQASQNEKQRKEAEDYVSNQLSDLHTQGIVKSKEDEKDLVDFAIEKKETNLLRAAEWWKDVKDARAEKAKSSEKTKARQGEGSKVGSSSKTQTEEQGGLDYEKVKKMDWFSF